MAVPTILNVDDREANRYARTRMLRLAGFDVTEAMTAREALALAGARPDLILLDVNLPDLSGLEVCRRLRSDPCTADIAIVHISATHTRSDDRAAGLESGADAYLVEPVDAPELIAVVRALMRTRQAEEAARVAAREARDALAVRDRFLASAAHELATPLTAVYAAIQRLQKLLARGDVERARAQAANARRSLSVLVEDVRALLDAGAADGTVVVHPERCDVVALLREVTEEMARAAATAGATLELDAPDTDVIAVADPLRLRQVVRNLLSNAVRHGRGPIGLRLRLTGEVMSIAVSDAGPGIPPADLDRIFQPYVRLDPTQRGLGLGLSIVRAIVAAMGGRIDVRSRAGEGTTFTVTVPLVAPA